MIGKWVCTKNGWGKVIDTLKDVDGTPLVVVKFFGKDYNSDTTDIFKVSEVVEE
jgi:hypothetical protein